MDRGKVIYALIAGALILGSSFLPNDWSNRIVGGYLVGVALLLVIVATGGAIIGGLQALRRRRMAARNPLDPSLRALMFSDLSWENCAQAPDFCDRALRSFRFLAEVEGFKPARMDPTSRVLTFRRGDVIVNVGEAAQRGESEEWIEVLLARSEESSNILAGIALGSKSDNLGDGFRGLAFHLQSNLDKIVTDLRCQVSSESAAG